MEKYQFLHLQREVYDKLFDIYPSLLGHSETFQKFCCLFDRNTVEGLKTIDWKQLDQK